MTNNRRLRIKRLKKMLNTILEDLAKASSLDYGGNMFSHLEKFPSLYSMFININNLASELFPDYQDYFNTLNITEHRIGGAINSCKKTLNIIESEKNIEDEISKKKIFHGAEDKLKIAEQAFQNQDFSTSIHNLNSALELLLKDLVDIPITITKISTNDVLNILKKYNAGPKEYFEEAKNHVLAIDNKMKHQGYVPTKIDCINAIRSVEDLIAKIRQNKIQINDEVKNKIYKML